MTYSEQDHAASARTAVRPSLPRGEIELVDLAARCSERPAGVRALMRVMD